MSVELAGLADERGYSMKGKGGPKPETPAEIAERKNDPTAEEIVGPENVIDVGTSATEEFTEPELQPQGYKCANCTFTSGLLSEMEEHVNGTGHGKFDTAAFGTAPVQPELFSTPGVIHREIKIPLDETLLNEKKTRLAKLYQSALDVKEEKKEADSDFNARLKSIDEQMQEIARVLKKPYTYENVKAEWHIIEGNARELRRVDTGEVLETKPLAMEDKIAEEEKAAIENAENAEEQKMLDEENEVEPEEVVN